MSPALASVLLRLLSHPASAPCNCALFAADPISRFDPSCVLQAYCSAADWQTDKQTQKAHQQAGVDASAVPIRVPTHPFTRITHRSPPPRAKTSTASLSLWLQTHASTHMHTQTRSHKQNSSFSLITFYSFVRRGSQRLIHCLTDSLQPGGELRIRKNFTICTLCKHDLRNISRRKVKEEDGAAGRLIRVCSGDFIHLQSVLGNQKWLFNFMEIEDCNISIPAATGRCLPGYVNAASAAADDDIWTSYITISHCAIRA